MVCVDARKRIRVYVHVCDVYVYELYMMVTRRSSGPAGGTAADLHQIAILNIRLLYKVAEYAKVYKC